MKNTLKAKVGAITAALGGLTLVSSAQTAIGDFDAATYAQQAVDKILGVMAIIVPIVIGVMILRIAIRFLKGWLGKS